MVRGSRCYVQFPRRKASSGKLPMTRKLEGIEWPWNNVRDNVKSRRSDAAVRAEPPTAGRREWPPKATVRADRCDVRIPNLRGIGTPALNANAVRRESSSRQRRFQHHFYYFNISKTRGCFMKKKKKKSTKRHQCRLFQLFWFHPFMSDCLFTWTNYFVYTECRKYVLHERMSHFPDYMPVGTSFDKERLFVR